MPTKKLKKFLLITGLFFIIIHLYLYTACAFEFNVGETLTYYIYAGGLKVGYQIIEVKGIKKINGKKVVELRGHSKSAPFVSLLYRLNDKWRVLIDAETLKPIRIEKDMVEGKKTGFIIYEIDQENLRVIMTDVTNNRVKELRAKNPVYDFISMVYKFRRDALLYSDIGKRITFDFLEANKTRTVSFINMGEIAIQNPLKSKKKGNKTVRATIYKQTKKPGIIFYVDSNEGHIPLKMEVKARLANALKIQIEVELKNYRPH